MEIKAAHKKHLHVIGICGVATSALAIAFHKKGWKVTGSDKGFFPPVSTELEKHGISFYAGWHPERMVADDIPDLIMMGGVGTSPSNPEVAYAREHGKEVLAYAEVLRDYFIKKNSIVITGTWGKTTTSSLLSFILIKAGFDPSYFTGGISLSHDTGALSDSDWSIMEGDEYQISISDKRPKFDLYKPTHLILTSVSWDHADLYPTREAYFNEFKKLVESVPERGFILASADDKGVTEVLRDAKVKCRVIKYGKSLTADYSYRDVTHTAKGLDFSINNSGKSIEMHSPMLGRYNAENITASFAMAHSIGIPVGTIVSAVADFKGIKRRFEKRLEADVTVLDCHAPTAEKAAMVLESIREVYKQKIVVVYEPNIGGRQQSSISMYDNAFKDADTVIIPRLTKLKVAENESEQPLEGDALTKAISKTHSNAVYLEDDAKLIDFLVSNAKKGDVIAFLGSHGFRGMIEETVSKLA